MDAKDKVENKAFLGRGWKFPVSFSKAGKQVLMSEFETDVKESLILLLSTIQGERIMRPGYGTIIRDMLFEPLDTTTATLIGEQVKRAILINEPRVFVERIEATQESLLGKIELHIDYTIIASNTRQNLVYPFYITEATHAEL
jgi:phage baseplate assembly protein W